MKGRILSFLKKHSFLTEAAIVVVFTLVVTRCVVMVGVVPSASMESTIPANSVVIYSRLAYLGDKQPQYEDIVVFQRDKKQGDKKYYTKRVIGKSGDNIELGNGMVKRNNRFIVENYLNYAPEYEVGATYTVPEGYCFLMGDNRDNSHDSRYWEEHYIPQENIVGKAILMVDGDGITFFD